MQQATMCVRVSVCVVCVCMCVCVCLRTHTHTHTHSYSQVTYKAMISTLKASNNRRRLVAGGKGFQQVINNDALSLTKATTKPRRGAVGACACARARSHESHQNCDVCDAVTCAKFLTWLYAHCPLSKTPRTHRFGRLHHLSATRRGRASESESDRERESQRERER
jgi:hypothetical protein